MDNQNFKYSYREGSKIDWGMSSQSPIIPTNDDIKLIVGSSTRIAQSRLMVGDYRNDQVKDLVLLLYLTGLRVGEALGLKFSDVDFEKKICFSFAMYCNVFETVVTSKAEFIINQICAATKKPRILWREHGVFVYTQINS